MPELSFEVYCDKCGTGLCSVTSVDRINRVRIEPCESCLEEAFEQGRKQGIEEASE